MGAGGVGVCICISCGVSFRVCMCVGLHVLWLPSVTCVGHVLSLLGWGRRRSRETVEHKGETQAGRQQAGGLPGRLSPHPMPAQVGGGGCLWAWTIHAAIMPLYSTMCSHPSIQAWSPPILQLLTFPTPRPLSGPSPFGSP